jgi:Ca2+-binding EF-hand superfamily protein
MSIRNELIWIIGFGMTSIVCAPETPCANRRAEAGDRSSATAPPPVEDRTPETAPAIPAKLLRYAQRLVKQYDRNGSGALEEKEWAAMPGNARKIDRNRDGVITVEELVDYLARYARSRRLQGDQAAWQRLPRPPAAIFRPASPAEGSRENPAVEQAGAPEHIDGEPSAEDAPSGNKGPLEGKRATAASRAARKYYVGPSSLPPGLPDWFSERDADGDGQLTLSEFAPDGSAAQRRLFARYDQNGDGVITPDEAVRVLKTSPENGKTSATAKQAAEKETSSSPARKPDRASSP